MKRKLEIATLGNVLRLFSKRLEDFSGESKRSYQKAYTSFQLYTVGNYSMSMILNQTMVENWMVDNILHGHTLKTVSFYLDKISSLYTRIASRLEGGREIVFKEIKRKLKELSPSISTKTLDRVFAKLHSMVRDGVSGGKKRRLLESMESFSLKSNFEVKKSQKRIWGCLALKAGVLPNVVKKIIGEVPSFLSFLNLCETVEINEEVCQQAFITVANSMKGEEPRWFAMRLRPKVKFDGIIDRFSLLADSIKMPELFYPCEEIAKRVGRKVVWKGKPVIRDVVFFRSRKSEIYPLFTKLYDLAWCYRTPGGAPGNYASIPDKAMEDFKNALGFLSPDFEVMPSGDMELKAGDKVVIVDGDYAKELAQVLKKPTKDEEGNKIYRVTLLNRNGHWDIGIDARLLKKE